MAERANDEKGKARVTARGKRFIPLSGELALTETAASLMIATSITSSLWSKVVTSCCYLHKD